MNTPLSGRPSSVDLVYTYVNPHDIDLSRERMKLARAEHLIDDPYRNGQSRYRDNGELRFAIQSARRFLPFINKIYVVHTGAVPGWLKEIPDTELIAQQELVPFELYPSFHSDVIESFIHQIPGLTEHYLYANDDFFFSAPHEISDFFQLDGCARVALCDRFAVLGDAENTFIQSELNSLRALEQHIDLRSPVRIPRKGGFFRRLSQSTRLRALRRGIPLLNTTTHVTQPYRRSLWSEFCGVFANELADLRKHRFRTNKGLCINFMFHHFARSRSAALFYYNESHRFLDRRHSLSERNRLELDLASRTNAITQFCLNDAESLENDGWVDFVGSLFTHLQDKRAWPLHKTMTTVPEMEFTDVSDLLWSRTA